MFHFHRWSRWSDPYEVTNYMVPIKRVEIYQKRVCKTCGLVEPHFLRIGYLSTAEMKSPGQSDPTQENKA